MATTTRKTTAQKPTNRASTVRRSRPEAAPAPEVSDGVDGAADPHATEVADAPDYPAELRRGELIDRVVEQTGIRKKFAKPVIEEVLAILGAELADGRALALQPMGRFKVTRQEELEKGRMIVARIRQTVREAGQEDGTEAQEPLAEPAE